MRSNTDQIIASYSALLKKADEAGEAELEQLVYRNRELLQQIEAGRQELLRRHEETNKLRAAWEETYGDRRYEDEAREVREDLEERYQRSDEMWEWLRSLQGKLEENLQQVPQDKQVPEMFEENVIQALQEYGDMRPSSWRTMLRVTFDLDGQGVVVSFVPPTGAMLSFETPYSVDFTITGLGVPDDLKLRITGQEPIQHQLGQIKANLEESIMRAESQPPKEEINEN